MPVLGTMKNTTRDTITRLLRGTIPDYKIREKKLKPSLAEQRIEATKQELNRLAKDTINIIEREKIDRSFGWIPNSVYSEVKLSETALGLLGFLVVYAGKVPMFENQLTVSNCNSTQLLRLLKCSSSNQKKRMEELLDELEEAGLISLQGDNIILTMGEISDYKAGYQFGFTKVYSSTVKKIMAHSKGITLLKHIGAYIGFRSQVFESYDNIEEQDENLLSLGRYNLTTAMRINKSIRSLNDEYKWFRDNNILKFVAAKSSYKYHSTMFVYSEEHDVPFLFRYVIHQLNGGKFLRLLS